MIQSGLPLLDQAIFFLQPKVELFQGVLRAQEKRIDKVVLPPLRAGQGQLDLSNVFPEGVGSTRGSDICPRYRPQTITTMRYWVGQVEGEEREVGELPLHRGGGQDDEPVIAVARRP